MCTRIQRIVLPGWPGPGDGSSSVGAARAISLLRAPADRYAATSASGVSSSSMTQSEFGSYSSSGGSTGSPPKTVTNHHNSHQRQVLDDAEQGGVRWHQATGQRFAIEAVELDEDGLAVRVEEVDQGGALVEAGRWSRRVSGMLRTSVTAAIIPVVLRPSEHPGGDVTALAGSGRFEHLVCPREPWPSRCAAVVEIRGEAATLVEIPGERWVTHL
jgi:hypothetical protein